MSIPFSVLDLMPTRPDDSHAQTMRKTVQAAQAAERFGFNRFWVAEHHNAGSLLSSATGVVMAEPAPPGVDLHLLSNRSRQEADFLRIQQEIHRQVYRISSDK